MVEERYEIRGKIGQGGVGAVYKAYDTQLRREVAIKRVLADEEDADNELATKNLLKEASALSSVQHPHICTVYDAGIDDDGPFVVMELINGKTLDQMIEHGSLTYEDFREVAIQTQEAMIAAQELNLVHRDLKPSNVMVSWLPSGRFQIKLVDFGLAKFSAKPSLQTIDQGDAVFGSIFFMAPEQFERVVLDQRTDMYSLGAMFYYTLTGNYPFDGDTAPQVMASHLQNTVIPLQQVRPDLPTWLCEWVMWHIQRDMNHRPDSARTALDKFLADESQAAQVGTGQTQKLITPNLQRTLITGPLTVTPQVGALPINPSSQMTSSVSVTPGVSNLTPKISTAPQPLLSPEGKASPSTAPVITQPAEALGDNTTATITSSIPIIEGSLTPNVAPAYTQPASQLTSESALVKTMPQSIIPAKKTMSRMTFIVIGSMLAMATIIMCFVIIGAKKEKDHQDTYSQLIKNIEAKEKLPVTREELKNLLLSMVKDTKDKIGGYTAMSKAVPKSEDFSPTLEIAKFITVPGQKIKDESMRQIIRAIAMNPKHDPEAHKLLLKYAIENPNKKHSGDAINRMKKFADDSFIEGILTVYDKTSELATRTSAANTLTEIIKRSNNKDSIADEIMERYFKAQDDQKLAYLRLVGATGSQEALKLLTVAIRDKDVKVRMSAARALSKFPTIEPFEVILAAYAGENNQSLNNRYRDSLFDLLESNIELSDEKRIELWTKFIQSSPTKKSMRHVIGRISGTKSEWATKLLEGILKNPDYDEKIKTFVQERLEEWSKN